MARGEASASAMAVAAIILAGPCMAAEAEQGASGAPPYVCEIRQAAWCLVSGAESYEDKPSRIEGYASQWTVRGPTWRDFPLIINEPVGCRAGLSDTVEVVSSESTVWQNQRWKVTKVRLKADKTCDLELRYADIGQDPQAGGFFAAMSLVRPCANVECRGDQIGANLRQHLRP